MSYEIKEAFSLLLKGLTETFWHLRETELPKPVTNFSEVIKPTEVSCFQLARKFKRPEEFLLSLLDMIKVTFYHDPMGNLLLNSNPSFILESFPDKPFRLGYLSVLSESNESFADLWRGQVVDSLRNNDYDLDQASSAFLVISAGEPRYGLDLIEEVGMATNAGFSIDSALSIIAAEIKNEDSEQVTGTHAGYVLCKELDKRLRVSLWIILKPLPQHKFTVIPGGK